MRKRTIIFLSLLSVFLAGASVFGYLMLFRKPYNHSVQNDTYRAVPLDAVLVQHFSQVNTLTDDLLASGGYLERFFHPGDGLGHFLKILKETTVPGFPGMKKAEALCSLHPSAKNTLSTLFCLSGSDARDPHWWSSYVDSTGIPYKTRSYDGQTIYTFYGENEDQNVYAVYVPDVLMVSPSLVVLESSLRHMKNGTSLMDDPEFARLVAETPVSKPVRIFFSHARIPSLFAAYLGVPLQKYAPFLSTTAGWTVLDGFVEYNQVRMDGYSMLSNGQEHFFAALTGQQTQSLMAPEVLPAATLAGLFLGFSDLQTYLDRYGRYLELHKKNRKAPGSETLEWFNLLYPTEVSLACIPFRSSAQWITVIHSRYIHQARIQYALLGKQEEGKVMENPKPGLLEDIFGQVFGLCPADHYCYVGSCILLGQKDLLNDILGKHSIGNYHSLADAVDRTKISASYMNASNLSLFLQPSVGLDLLESVMDKRYTDRLREWRMYNAQFVFLQFSALEDRMYTHLSVYGDSLETSPLIPRQQTIRVRSGSAQDSLVRESPPYTVYNHFTRKDNELYQTPWPECRLILRDHVGKTLWEKTMEGTIQDRVEQIDFLKNNKLQMLFSIGNRLYLLDRLGRNVSPYPRAYTTSILYGPYVFDPRGNKDYLILLVHQDNVLRCYNRSGVGLPQWNDFLIPDYLTGKPHYILTGETGAWVIYTNSQTVVLSQEGQIRAMVTQKDCLDPQAEIEISGPYELRGTTIEGKPLTIMLN
ncbi:MAG: hypothetical protein WC395_04130 [Bacteroidales bacterium]|jgi:hypothetical protein